MKIELHCPSCQTGYVVDPARIPRGGGVVRCRVCDAAIPVASPENPTAKPVEPGRRAPDAVPVRSVTAPQGEVSCPRCGLHFVPSAGKVAEPINRPVILVVEDMDYFREIARDALAQKYEVKCAGSVADALRILSSSHIDLILLDLNLEHGEDGLTLLRTLPEKSLPVLAFTAQDESEMYGEAWARLQGLGVDDVVRKGMNLGETLLRKVATLLGERDPAAGPAD